MADEEKNEQTESQEPEEAAEGHAPGAEPADDSPEAEAGQAGDGPAAEAEGADDAPAEEPAADAPAEEAPAAGAEEIPAEDPLEGLDWKARRRLLRSRESGEAGPQLSAEERSAERAERRRAARARRAAYRRKSRAKQERREGTPPAERTSVARKVRRGTVISNKADKTITVRIDIARRHPAYEKIVRRSSTLRAHDERNEANEGDLVRLVETRPQSRTKRWRLAEILERAK